MTDFAPLSIDGFPEVSRTPAGPAPILQWVEIAALVVDRSYQRQILRAGRRNVIAIARDFDWSKFAPIIVAPVEGGRYAIIDGQHRSTAALLLGIASVPAQVVPVEARAQASAFAAINGTVTPIGALHVHRASLAAGDPGALAIEDCAARAGVRILPYPRQTADHAVGDTMSIKAIELSLRRYGLDHTVTALQCITETADGNAGLVVANAIKGFVLALDRAPDWREAGGRLFDVLDDFSIEDTLDIAGRASARAGISTAEHFARAVLRHLAGHDLPEQPKRLGHGAP
jgi:ParB/Sulfiredoxin domain